MHRLLERPLWLYRSSVTEPQPDWWRRLRRRWIAGRGGTMIYLGERRVGPRQNWRQ